MSVRPLKFFKASQKPRLLTLLCGLMFAGLLLVAAPSATDAQTLYRAGQVITMEGTTFSPGAVLVQDGKITAIGDSIDAGEATVFDFGDQATIFPGLIDAYSQAGLSSATRDEPTDEVTPNFSVANAIEWNSLSLAQALANGTTTLCLTPGTENVFAGRATIIKSPAAHRNIVQSDAGLVANLTSDPTRGNQSRQRPDRIYMRQPTNRMGVVWILRHNFHTAINKPDSTDSLNSLRECVRGDRKLFVVSRTAPDLETALTLADEFGLRPILVGGQESYRVLDLLAAKQVKMILTTVPTGTTSGPERTEICLNRAGMLADAGVDFCLSGDDLRVEAAFAVRHGLDHDQALKAITITPAQILGVADQVGSLAVGKNADFIVLNGPPLEFTTRIEAVVVDGQIALGTNPQN